MIYTGTQRAAIQPPGTQQKSIEHREEKAMTNYTWNVLNGFITPEDFDGKETTFTIAHLASMAVDEEKRTGKKSIIVWGGIYR